MVVVMFIHAGNYRCLLKKKSKIPQSKEIINFGKTLTEVLQSTFFNHTCLVCSTF